MSMKILHTRSDDGSKIRLGRWNENGSKDILLVHGLAEHLGRYDFVGNFFAQRDWRVTMVELRGHGESDGRRGHVDMWIRYVEDIQAVMGTVGRPMAIVGHSMGGLAVLHTMMHSLTPPVKCVALSNPLLGLFLPLHPIKIQLGRILSKTIPWMPLPNEVVPENLCRDPKIVQAYKNDPMCFTNITSRWGREMLLAKEQAHQYAPKYNLPLLMLVGGCDRICAPESAREFMKTYAENHDASLGNIQEYPFAYHELFNEPEKEDILGNVETWFQKYF